MLFFGHVGITVGAVQAYAVQRRRSIDLRKAVFLALLPDLIDKPLGLLYPNAFGNHTRLYAHSLLFSFVLFALFAASNTRIRDRVALWFCLVGHLFMDRMWINSKEYLLWPALGTPPPLSPGFLRRWYEAFFQPYNFWGELIGLAILVFLVFRHKLYRPRPLKNFIATGLLEPQLR
jgi:hypothetical protein